MDTKFTILTYVLFLPVPLTKAAVPGTFFWKPRVALDLAVPTYYPRTVKRPTQDNINKGFVVLVEGYQAGLTVAAIAEIIDVMVPFPHLSPGSAYYYTNMYRWMLRYLSLIPDWLGGHSGYADTHKVWRRRYYYMDKFVPQWMRSLLFFVSKDEWKKEDGEWRRWSRYGEPSFGKYYKYPSKKFNNWNSMRVAETVENLDVTDASIHGRGKK